MRELSDIRHFESTPLPQRLLAASIYGLFERSHRLYGDRPTPSFQQTGDPGERQITYTHKQLLVKINQTANDLLSVGPGGAGPCRPDLRAHAIKRVFDAELSKEGINATVTVRLDEKPKLTAFISCEADLTARVQRLLGGYPESLQIE